MDEKERVYSEETYDDSVVSESVVVSYHLNNAVLYLNAKPAAAQMVKERSSLAT